MLRLILRELVPVETARFTGVEATSCRSTLAVRGVGGRDPLIPIGVSTRGLLNRKKDLKIIIKQKSCGKSLPASLVFLSPSLRTTTDY